MLLYQNNIKEIMGWSDNSFEVFLLNWKKTHEIHITSSRPAFIYSDDYFHFLLPMFFVICQTDFNSKTKVVDKKVVLLTLLTFYLTYDVALTKQSVQTVETIKIFLNSIKDLKLINEDLVRKTTSLLSLFIVTDEEYQSDLISKVDFNLVKDLLISSNPIIVDKSHAMFYYDQPSKTTFLSKKPYPKAEQFFDEMFAVSQTITDNFLRTLYSERLSRLMETQYKTYIFPI